MKEEILKEFVEVFGKMPDRVLLISKDGREFCSWCGHPSSADVQFKKMKEFISESIDKALSARDEEWREKIEIIRENLDTLGVSNPRTKDWGIIDLAIGVLDDLINSMK